MNRSLMIITAMKTTTILFDMDGTLLPMDPDKFTAYYFHLLNQMLSAQRCDPKPIDDAIWYGTAAMIKNDGTRRNIDVFWDAFNAVTGAGDRERALLEKFYSDEFDRAAVSCGYTPRAAETVSYCMQRGWNAVLATNPIFPAEAMCIRLRWAGVDPSRFSYITSYENSSFCKPNPDYYREILDTLHLQPDECVMVGNDADEDMIAGTLGMRVFLLTENLLNRSASDINQYPHGNYNDLMRFLQSLT